MFSFTLISHQIAYANCGCLAPFHGVGETLTPSIRLQNNVNATLMQYFCHGKQDPSPSNHWTLFPLETYFVQNLFGHFICVDDV